MPEAFVMAGSDEPPGADFFRLISRTLLFPAVIVRARFMATVVAPTPLAAPITARERSAAACGCAETEAASCSNAIWEE